MISRSWRRVVLSSLAAVLLLLPAASQAAPRPSRTSPVNAVEQVAEPTQWLGRFWEAVTGLWQAMTAGSQTNTNGLGGSNGTSDLNGDSGNTIDPDGNHG